MGVRINGLRELRRARGLTRVQLSQRAGVSLATVALLERGHPTASIRTIRQLAHGLEIPVEDLLRGTSAPNEDAAAERG